MSAESLCHTQLVTGRAKDLTDRTRFRGRSLTGSAGLGDRLFVQKIHAATANQKVAQASTTAVRMIQPIRSTRCALRKAGTGRLEETQSLMTPALPQLALKTFRLVFLSIKLLRAAFPKIKKNVYELTYSTSSVAFPNLERVRKYLARCRDQLLEPSVDSGLGARMPYRSEKVMDNGGNEYDE